MRGLPKKPVKVNLRLLLAVIASIADDILVIFLVIVVMHFLGIATPWWLIGVLIMILLTWSFIGYRALTKNPTLGFENVVGRQGLAVGRLKPKGTVRIGHELWQAQSDEPIEPGTEIEVVRQSGLNLTVVRRQHS